MAHCTGLPLSSFVYPSQSYRGAFDREPPLTRVRQSLAITDFVFGCSLPFIMVFFTSVSSVNAALKQAVGRLCGTPAGGFSLEEVLRRNIAAYPDELTHAYAKWRRRVLDDARSRALSEERALVLEQLEEVMPRDVGDELLKFVPDYAPRVPFGI